MPTIHVDFDQKCAECLAPGRTENALCMHCSNVAMDPTARFRSAEGRAVQARWADIKARGTTLQSFAAVAGVLGEIHQPGRMP